jgi:hypothetical protein
VSVSAVPMAMPTVAAAIEAGIAALLRILAGARREEGEYPRGL